MNALTEMEINGFTLKWCLCICNYCDIYFISVRIFRAL